jgi:hypothetical protein
MCAFRLSAFRLSSGLRFSIAFCFLLSLGCAVAQDENGAKDGGKGLDKAHFRLKVERVGEPAYGFEMYRIRVWTVDKKQFSIESDNGVSQGGKMGLEKDSKLYRGEARIIISSLGVFGNMNKIETWIRISWGKDVTTSRRHDLVLQETPWSKIVEITPQAGLHKIDQTITLGKINGRPLEVGIDLRP